MSLGSSPSCGSTATCTTTGPPATRSVRTRSSTSASPRSSTGSYSTPASSRGRPRRLCRDPPAGAGPGGSAHGRIPRAGGDRGRLGAGAGSAGPTRGARVRRLGDARDALAVTSRGPRQAHLEGFDLHANVWVSANDRAGVERLCRYVFTPPKLLRESAVGEAAQATQPYLKELGAWTPRVQQRIAEFDDFRRT